MKVLNCNNENAKLLPNTPLNTNECLNREFTSAEVCKAITFLKNNKAAGVDGSHMST